MNLIYGIKDKPKFGQMLLFAFQQVLAILAATIAVPSIIGNGRIQYFTAKIGFRSCCCSCSSSSISTRA